jgi:hypothetical protein
MPYFFTLKKKKLRSSEKRQIFTKLQGSMFDKIIHHLLHSYRRENFNSRSLNPGYAICV